MNTEQNWRNRVELSLDNRQIFLLFFASAIVIGLVFALGVVVGKRYQPELINAGAATDPLAMLDQLGQEPEDDNLTFHETLSNGADPKVPPIVVPTPEIETPVNPGPGQRPSLPPQPTVSQPTPLPSVQPTTPRVDTQGTPEVVEDSGKKKIAKAPKLDTDLSKDADDSTYTLQLSSFQEKAEADRFMQKLKSAGMTPYMTPTDIPGRGIWYRVRLGNFRTWEKALEAKQKFESGQQIIAYVMKR